MASRKLIVEVVGDARSLEKALGKAQRDASRFGRRMDAAGRTGSTFFSGLSRTIPFVGAALAGFGVVLAKSVDNASDLNEAMTQTDRVFEKSAGQVKAWSETTARGFGIAEQQALQTAAGFGALLRPIGIIGPQAAQQSKALTELGADLASFYNTDVQQALDAIRSGLVGEAEPLRQYGVRLSEARVQALAMAQSGKKTAAALTDQEKTVARLAIIYQDTTLAQGDFARTSEGLANQQRILTAQLRDASTKIGQALLPVVLDVTEALNDWLSQPENIDKISDAIEDLVRVTGKMVDVAQDVADAWGDLQKALKQAWLEMKRDAIEGVLGIIEPFTHIPTGAFDWARDLKRDLVADLDAINDAAARLDGTLMGLSEHALDARRNRAAITAAAARTPIPTVTTAAAAAAAARTRGGLTPEMRNRFFDARVARQLDRLQDLSLRRQLAQLREIAQAIRARIAITKDLTRRLNLEDRLLGVLREQRSVQAEIADQIRAANEALKDRADAIKSAVLDRLQRRQTDILNKRALADAKEQLRIARQIGGPEGVKQALRALQDAQFDILRARFEAAPATLTKGGKFQLGTTITINVHGAESPEQVANKVVQIIERRRRRTTTQTRGPAAGSHSGQK